VLSRTGQARSTDQNDKAEANDLSATHIAAQSPSDKSPATANMARAFGDWNATKSDGDGCFSSPRLQRWISPTSQPDSRRFAAPPETTSRLLPDI